MLPLWFFVLLASASVHPSKAAHDEVADLADRSYQVGNAEETAPAGSCFGIERGSSEAKCGACGDLVGMPNVHTFQPQWLVKSVKQDMADHVTALSGNQLQQCEFCVRNGCCPKSMGRGSISPILGLAASDTDLCINSVGTLDIQPSPEQPDVDPAAKASPKQPKQPNVDPEEPRPVHAPALQKPPAICPEDNSDRPFGGLRIDGERTRQYAKLLCKSPGTMVLTPEECKCKKGDPGPRPVMQKRCPQDGGPFAGFDIEMLLAHAHEDSTCPPESNLVASVESCFCTDFPKCPDTPGGWFAGVSLKQVRDKYMEAEGVFSSLLCVLTESECECQGKQKAEAREEESTSEPLGNPNACVYDEHGKEALMQPEFLYNSQVCGSTKEDAWCGVRKNYEVYTFLEDNPCCRQEYTNRCQCTCGTKGAEHFGRDTHITQNLYNSRDASGRLIHDEYNGQKTVHVGGVNRLLWKEHRVVMGRQNYKNAETGEVSDSPPV